MTISLAWVRSINTTSELVLATDSRLAFGCRWDCCPKLLALPRGDAAMCFAGNTMYAYPIMLQAIAAVSQHPRISNRAMDLEDLKGHILRVLHGMVSVVHDLPIGGENTPDTTFLLAGWSWKRSHFRVWLLHHDANLGKFTFRPVNRWKGSNGQKVLAFTGDYEVEYKQRLVEILRKKGKLKFGGFDMEPLEVLRDMLREPAFDLIGGAPQVLKIYKHCSSRPYAVLWPNKEVGTVSLGGRTLLEYEQSPFPVLDTDGMKTFRYTPRVLPPKDAISSVDAKSDLTSSLTKSILNHSV